MKQKPIIEIEVFLGCLGAIIVLIAWNVLGIWLDCIGSGWFNIWFLISMIAFFLIIAKAVGDY